MEAHARENISQSERLEPVIVPEVRGRALTTPPVAAAILVEAGKMSAPVTISSKTTDIVTSIVGPFAGTFAGIGTLISWQNLRLAQRDEERKKRSDLREAGNRRRSTSTDRGSDDEGPRPRDDNSHYRRAALPVDPLLTATFEVSSSPGPPVQEAQDGRGDEEITHPTAYQRERLPSVESGGAPTLEGGSFSPNNIMLRQIQTGEQIQWQEGKYPVTTPDPVPTPPTTVGTKAQPSFSASPRNVSLPVYPDSPNSASQNKRRWSRGSMLSETGVRQYLYRDKHHY